MNQDGLKPEESHQREQRYIIEHKPKKLIENIEKYTLFLNEMRS